MKLIIGLGNPGKEYSSTRHNVGFLLLDTLAKEWKADFQEKSKFNAHIAEINIQNEKVWLMKPTTFYNMVGDAAHKIKDFYKLENKDILVIHDDMALPFGTLRTRFGGSSAGNNGIKSLSAHLGEDYARLRVGMWNESRPHIEAVDFVLGKLTQKEKEGLRAMYPDVIAAAITFVQNRLEPTTVVKH